MPKTIQHMLHSDFAITLDLYTDVKNAKDLRHGVMSGEFEATLLKTSMITDPFQVIVAANKAVHLFKQEKMTTKNVHSEVLFCLSPTKNISDSFRKFGISDTDTSLFVVIINDKGGATQSLIQSRVDGTQMDLEAVSSLTDLNALKKIYKVTDTELQSCTLSNAVVSKIASKEFVTV